MKPERVRFSSYSSSVRVLNDQCTNPACPCSEVTFDLVGVVEAGAAASPRLRLRIRVDPETWREIEPPARPAATDQLIQEFLRDYPISERLTFVQAMHKKQRVARRLRDYRFDTDTLSGRLVSFDEIVSEPGAADPPNFLDRFEYDGRTYLIMDLYCANPSCACSEARLEFLLVTPSSQPDMIAVAKPHFMVRLSLDGILKFENSIVGTDAENSPIADAWWQDAAEFMEDLRWRYAKIKEIAARSIPGG